MLIYGGNYNRHFLFRHMSAWGAYDEIKLLKFYQCTLTTEHGKSAPVYHNVVFCDLRRFLGVVVCFIIDAIKMSVWGVYELTRAHCIIVYMVV